MMHFIGRFARSQLALFLPVIAAACQGDGATEPRSRAPALQLQAVSATDLLGTVGGPVDPVPTVMVRNASGQPVPGMEVTFTLQGRAEVISGDSVTKHVVITDGRGVASVGDWILGTVMGTRTLEASIQGAHVTTGDSSWVGHALSFAAQGQPAAPVVLSVTPGEAIVALPGAEVSLPGVYATDQFGNRVSSAAITFAITSGGGSVSTTRRTWTLGPAPGLNSLVASVPGLSPLTFTALARDTSALVWYDVQSPAEPMLSGSIALGADGIFELVTLFDFPDLLEKVSRHELGTYTLTGNDLLLTYTTGATERGTLVGDTLSLPHNLYSAPGQPPVQLSFVKRHDSAAILTRRVP